jgi:hypothetical protein
MKLFIGLLVGAVMASLPPQAAHTNPNLLVQRMCGLLTHTRQVPEKTLGLVQEKTEPSRNLRLELYVQQADTPCCDRLAPARKTITDGDGKYRFIRVRPGHYWLAFQFDRHQYAFPFRYEAVRHADPACVAFYLDLDETRNPPLDRGIIVE